MLCLRAPTLVGPQRAEKELGLAPAAQPYGPLPERRGTKAAEPGSFGADGSLRTVLH